MAAKLTGTGIWSGVLRYGDAGEAAAAATELEALGYSALWIPDIGGDVFGSAANLLRATTTATVATGILNLWMHTAQDTAAAHADLTARHGDRFLVGIGISHQPFVDRVKQAGAYDRPLARTAAFLDELDAAVPALAPANRCLAALGPKMLELARRRTAGVHPYLVTPEHTAGARAAVGPDALVAPEQAVVLETDPVAARAIARTHLATYLGLPNYANNWLRLGYTTDDIANGGSDRLVDALVAWGDDSAIRMRVQAHRDAGADHVCVQVLGPDPSLLALAQMRALAPALTSD